MSCIEIGAIIIFRPEKILLSSKETAYGSFLSPFQYLWSRYTASVIAFSLRVLQVSVLHFEQMRFLDNYCKAPSCLPAVNMQSL